MYHINMAEQTGHLERRQTSVLSRCSYVDLGICVAEELTHHINIAVLTSCMEGRPTILSGKVDLDICAAEELTYHIHVALLTSQIKGRHTVLRS